MKQDVMDIEILADGLIKTTSGKISPANHHTAEDFLQFVAQLTGGETKRVKRGRAHEHGHQHHHAQEHQ